MEEIKKIAGSSCGRFPNALHAQFHQRMYSYISAPSPGAEKISVSADLLAEYLKNINLEVDLNREARASADTAILGELDEDRDQLIDYLFGAINNAARSPLAAHKTAYAILSLIIKPYTGLKNEAVDTETAHISGLVTDLKKPENAAQITALGLTDIVTALEAKNKEYETTRTARTETRAAQAMEDTKTVRPRTDSCYQRICDCIYASLLLCKTAEDRPAIETLIDSMNQTIAEFKASYNMSQGQKKAATQKKQAAQG